MPDTLLDRLARVFPPDRLLTHAGALAPYESDGLTTFRARPRAVVLVESTDEVVQTVRICHEAGVPFMARGSGTSLSGGAVPIEDGIVIALNRLNRILRIDPEARLAVVQPGVVNLDVSAAAARHGLYYAPDPSSQSVCTIGGNVAFNSGGAHCFRHGMTANHVLALTVILPDGEVAHLGSESIEPIGPDLAGLFVGSEGLFGIAVEITLRLIQRPESYRTVLAGYSSLQAAGDAVTQIVASGLLPGAMEIMDRLAIDAAEAAVDAGYPKGAAAILLVELEGDALEVDVEFARLTALIDASGATSTRTASDADDRARIWKGRKCAFSAVGRLSPDFIVQDGVVPRTRLGEALAAIERLSREHGIRVANVFHAGDGNLHPLILFDGRDAGALERAEQLAADILRLCISLGGSITGEHGVGLEKRAFLGEMFEDADIAFMQRLRHSIDPQELANRGKMLAGESTAAPQRARAAPAREGGRDLARMTAEPTTSDALRVEVLRHHTVRLRGGGTKSSTDAGVTLSVRGLSGIVDYSRDECVLTALAGTPLAEIETALAANDQYLPFDPPLASQGATIGGTVAAGASGPLRYRYGGVRDFVIGVRVIDGEGRSIRSGGKVVKNAAGFLLHHAMVGSQGAFGVLSEVTIKVFPKPEARASVVVNGGGLEAAAKIARTLESMRLDLEALDFDGSGTVWVRLAGRGEALGARVARVISVAGGTEVPAADEGRIWAEARDFAWAPSASAIVRIPLSGTASSLIASSAAAQASTQDHSSPLQHDGVRYTCGGRSVWAATSDVAALARSLASSRLRGVIVRGAGAGTTIGAVERNVFEERVRRVLDPHNRFRAASHPA